MKMDTGNDKILLYRLPVGKLAANCYIVVEAKSKKAMVVDPGGEGEYIVKFLKDNDFTPLFIVDTHCHWDHTGANVYVKEATGAPLCIHEADAVGLREAGINLSVALDDATGCGEADRLLHDGDILQIGDLAFRVLHTPGHTPGGISLLCENIVLVGDTLFAGSMGRTDLVGGDGAAIAKSLKEVLMALPDDTLVFTGHGPATTIGKERQFNPYCK